MSRTPRYNPPAPPDPQEPPDDRQIDTETIQGRYRLSIRDGSGSEMDRVWLDNIDAVDLIILRDAIDKILDLNP